MDSLHTYDSASSASDESDIDVDSNQKDKKSKRKPLVGCKEKIPSQLEYKRSRMLNSAEREESKSVSFEDRPCKRTPKNGHHEISTNPAITTSKHHQCDFLDWNSTCSRSSVYSSRDNKVSETCSTRILTKPSSNRLGRGTKPYIPKRERLTGITDATKRNIQPEMREADSDFKLQDQHSEQDIDRSKQQSIKSTCRPPKQLHISFQGHSQGVNCVRWNPSRSNLLLSASMDHIVCVWDTRGTGSCVRRFTCHAEAVKDSKWSPCGTQVLSCGYDKTARLSDLQTGQEIQKFPNRDYVTCVEFHPTNPSLFLAGTFKSAILCYDTRTGNIELTYSACFGQVQDLAFIPGEEEFISAAEVIRRNSTDKGIMVWDFRSTAVLSNQIYQEAFTCTCLRVHPHESHFVAQSNGDYIALFSTKKPYKLNRFKRYEGHKVSGYHIGCDFSPDGIIVSSGSADGNMFFYNHSTSQIIRTHQAHGSPCMDVTYHPSLPSCVASCGWDGQVKVWI